VYRQGTTLQESANHTDRAPMKYYVYISDAKVDMLPPQTPHDAKERSPESLALT
jgi:hypothetical protein